MRSPIAVTRASPYVPALDGLRGLAVLLVVPHNVNTGAQGLARVFTFTAGAGWIGVQLFFVLSGFLITRNLLESRGAPNYYRSFFARRILRIFPLYFIFLFLALIVLPAIGLDGAQSRHDRTHQVWLWTFLVNWTLPFGATVVGFGQFWSLGVEEQFYAIWPSVVAKWAHRLLALCAILVGAALALRVLFLVAGLPLDTAYTFTVARMDAVALGAAIAVASHEGRWRTWFARADRSLWIGLALLAFGYVVTVGYPARTFLTLTVGQTLTAFAFALIVLAAVSPGGGWWRVVLEHRWLRAAGIYSYGMYVLHLEFENLWKEQIMGALHWTGIWQPVAYMLVITILSFAAAFASYHLIERHFLRLKRFFAPSAPPAS